SDGLALGYSNIGTTKVYSNTIVRTPRSAIVIPGGNLDDFVDIKNNILVDADQNNEGWTTFRNERSPTSTSAIVNLTTNLCLGKGGSTSGGPSVATGPPLFADYSGNNFQLSSALSAAVGAGTTLPSPFNVDITGATRTVPFDIGAYKFGGGVIVGP